MYKYTKTEKHKKQKMNTYIHTKTQPKQEEKKIIIINMYNINEFTHLPSSSAFMFSI